MHPVIELGQGTTCLCGGNVIGFSRITAKGLAALQHWDETDRVWTTQWRLQLRGVFCAGGRFLCMDALLAADAEHRAMVHLAELGDAGGIAAADATHAVLPAGGYLDIGLTRMRLIAGSSPRAMRARLWPKTDRLAEALPDDIRDVELSIGSAIAIGNIHLHVQRLQMQAGDIPAFATFSVQRQAQHDRIGGTLAA